MDMSELENVIKWLEYDYLPRVGAYRKDCKQGCDACMPMHDGDDYCDIDMLCKILAVLNAQKDRHRLEVHNIGNVDIPEGVSEEHFHLIMNSVVEALQHTDKGESYPYEDTGR